MATRGYKRSARYRGLFQYDTADGKRWGAIADADPDWQTGSRRQIRKMAFRTQDEARQWQVDFQDKRRRGDLIEPSMQPLGSWMEEWLSTRPEIKPTTRRLYRRHFDWLADLHAIPLARLTSAAIERSLLGLIGPNHRISSVANVRRSLSTCLRAAMRHGLIQGNPAALAAVPAGDALKPVALSMKEVDQLLAATENDGQWHTLWRFVLETCLRLGEFLELRWSDVDLDTRSISISRNQSEGERPGSYVVSTPKTKNSVRTILISPELVAVLRKHRVSQMERALGLGQRWSDDVLVFPDESGKWLRRLRVRRQLERACIRAGVPVITAHGLRHTGGSIAHDRRVNIKVISERMGHRDVMTTYRIYVHTDDDQHRAAADAIGGLFRPENQQSRIGS